VNGQNRYSGVFVHGTGGYYLWANVTWENFRAKWQQLGGQGMRLIDYEWIHTGSGPSYDIADAASSKLMAPADLELAEESEDGMGFLGDAAGEPLKAEEAAALPVEEPQTSGAEMPSADEAVGGMVTPDAANAELEHGGVSSDFAAAEAPAEDTEFGSAVFEAVETGTDVNSPDAEEHGQLVMDSSPYAH